MYNGVINAMSGARTLSEHISKLQGILDSSPSDQQLVTAIRQIIKELMHLQAHAITKRTSSQKVRLTDSQTAIFRQVYAYCQQRAKAGEPDWMIAARNAGWTPPQTKS